MSSSPQTWLSTRKSSKRRINYNRSNRNLERRTPRLAALKSTIYMMHNRMTRWPIHRNRRMWIAVNLIPKNKRGNWMSVVKQFQKWLKIAKMMQVGHQWRIRSKWLCRSSRTWPRIFRTLFRNSKALKLNWLILNERKCISEPSMINYSTS